MEQIRVGIVGLGDGGRLNYEACCQIGVPVVAVCDANTVRLASVASIPATQFTRVEDLVGFKEVNVVVIATPDHLHLGSVKLALAAGKHVFIEKPVATTIYDLLMMRQLARAHPGKLWYSENHSFTPQVEAVLDNREALGEFLTGNTLFAQQDCERIMGNGAWRTETRYNPAAGGLSHNFMQALLFALSRIARISARGQVVTYHENLDREGGYDTMTGTLQFESGRFMSWTVALGAPGSASPYRHRPIIHTIIFRNGHLTFAPDAAHDELGVGERLVSFAREPSDAAVWREYFSQHLYPNMLEDVFAAIRGEQKPRHTIEQGINVAAACAMAFESAKAGGIWVDVEL